MKRLHVHVRVEDLTQSIQFYSTLFGENPTVSEKDYAKWLLDNPKVNFAISPALANAGIDHIGIQTESSEELNEVSERLHSAGFATKPQEAANCCYAVSDKHWIQDPSGVKWETFFTHGSSTVYGDDGAPSTSNEHRAPAACC